ncbi:hypothetical protein DQW50_07720 [Halorubrum sp. 48-1-W]|uniref:hypothetical protein n=1 Tax=Halorubrum sp. 48-1-W TaxID=2249761 RepID=UPI000DCB0360|nr:hypothetical protein [Halorubrum sp. 48-1-W]RAW45632.1 hypothetical protein DQW50_07720 [Halorubrum sp. 48-1-W]
MKRHYYDFFGAVLLEVRGDGGRSTGQFYTMFDRFEVDDPDREPDVVIERTTEDVESETVLGDPGDHYGWTGDRFVVRDGSKFMAVEPGWDHIYVSPDWEPFFATYPVEFRIREALVEDGYALVHGSAVELNGETTVFPAWRGGGKTNTLISLLREGADFLSDDRLWVGVDGTALGYPLAVNLQPYNVQSFPELEVRHDGLRDRARHEVSEFIELNVDSNASLAHNGVNFLNRKFLTGNGRSFTTVEEMFPRADHVAESTVDDVVVLGAAPNSDHVAIEEASADRVASATDAISYFEWNELLEEYFRAYDALCPGPSITERLEDVVDAEAAVFRELFADVGTYRAAVPRSAEWHEDGLDREIVDGIRSLSDTTEPYLRLQ